jgi:EmrB/QacA subfamily drug resistance transporter
MKRGKSFALLATIIGSGVVFLDGTVVNLALPKIADNLHAGFSSLQWIADGYLLSLSALILLGGSLGDIFGRKKVYLFGLAGFGLTSLLCGLAPNTAFLIGLRILQGVFGALLVPGALAIINTNFPKEERSAAIGQWAAWSGAFTAIGPLVGGYLIDTASWRWIFFINVPLIAVCGYLASMSIEESRDKRVRRVDAGGAVLAGLALAGITYGLIEGPVNKWAVGSMVPLLLGFVLALVFVIYESRNKDPMVRLSLFGSRNFTGSNLMTFAMYGALSGFMFSLVIYLQTKMHYSSVKAGLSLIPVTIMLLLFSSRVGKLSYRLGPRLFMTIGPLIAAAGMFLLANFKPGDSYLTFLLPCVLLFGIGLVLLVAPLTTTVMASVNESSSGIASGINNAVSRIAGLVVIALLGLAGTGNTFRFGIFLSAALAASAGVISLLLVQNPKKLPKQA